MKSIKIIAIAVIAFFATATSANVKLPHVISSNMVLQRNEPIKIWGWADKGEKVSVTFNGKKVAAKRISADKWEAIFPATKEGGPYEIIIVGKNRIELKNIMIGDVWICSGQSNMEWTLQKTDNVEAELAVAENNDIRLLNIPQTVSEIPVDDMPQCEWKTCSAETAAEFSGVGYYFGKYLQQNIGVPIGHSVIALKSIQKGLNKLILNEDKLKADLEANWSVVAEALQTILRREGYPKPYETLKELTRTNSKVTAESIHEFIQTLNVSDEVKQEMMKITPHNYTGIYF